MTILCLDFRGEQQGIFLLTDDGRVQQNTSNFQRGGFQILAQAISDWDLRRKPPAAIAVIALTGDGRPTWSVMRGLAAMVNTLALAWDIPLFSVVADSQEPSPAVFDRVRESAATAKKCDWFRPEYGGEPHITVPKVRV